MRKAFFALLCGSLILSGCTFSRAPSYENAPTMDQIYDHANNQGSAQTIQLMREAMNSSPNIGAQDPYIPIRKPEVIVPVYNPPQTNKATGSRIEGFWEHYVVKEAEWTE